MENQKEEPEAILVNSINGKIEAVGTLEQVEAVSGACVYKENLCGKCLMPAFIDAHSHISMNAQMALCADLSTCKTFDDIIKKLKDYIDSKKIKKAQAVIGFGYDHNFLLEQEHPNRHVLDEASRDIPIMILHISGHLACVNSITLELAGITKDTPNPPGGLIGRGADGKEPNGYLEETGIPIVQEVVQSRLMIDRAAMLEQMQATYIEHGVTTVQDGATVARDLMLLKEIAKAKLLKVDVVAYPLMTAGGEILLRDNRDMIRKYQEHLKIGGYKLVLDGSPQGRSAWMSKPYLEGPEGYCGYPWLEDHVVKKYVKQAVEEGQQLLAHCNGDAASEQYLDAYEEAIEDSNREDKHNLRPVMIHCQTVRNDQLDRMAKLNMIASIFVGHVWYWGDIHLKNFGMERGRHISPVRDAMKRGIMVNYHQDTPVTKPDMLHSVWCAVTRRSRNGIIIGEEQKVSVFEALKAVTINAAYQYFEENDKGSIKTGKRADLIILDRSPLEVSLDEIKDIQVLQTLKDGNVIFKKE